MTEEEIEKIVEDKIKSVVFGSCGTPPEWGHDWGYLAKDIIFLIDYNRKQK